MGYTIVCERDPDPDMSWLAQAIYDPASPEYDGPIYPTEADAKAGTNAYDPDWYRNPDNHAPITVEVFRANDETGELESVGILGSVDYLDGKERIGTWYVRDGKPERPRGLDEYVWSIALDYIEG